MTIFPVEEAGVVELDVVDVLDDVVMLSDAPPTLFPPSFITGRLI